LQFLEAHDLVASIVELAEPRPDFLDAIVLPFAGQLLSLQGFIRNGNRPKILPDPGWVDKLERSLKRVLRSWGRVTDLASITGNLGFGKGGLLDGRAGSFSNQWRWQWDDFGKPCVAPSNDNDDDDGALVGDEGAGGRETPESVDSVEVVLAPSEQRADEWDAKRDVCDERWKNDDDDEEAVAFGGAGICAERENERESRRRRPCC